MFTACRAALVACTFFTASSAFAILPQQGMWGIGSEVNGKPGRGIQLDRQGGKYIIITYFGYRPDGTSMFLQASGQISDSKLFSGQLTEFKGGRHLGGPARDGEVARVVGPVFIEFDSTTSGTITLPGEAPQRLSRYQYEDHLARINNKFEYGVFDRQGKTATKVTGQINASADSFSMTETYEGGETCQYSGDFRRTGDSFASRGVARCTLMLPILGTKLDRYQIADLKVDEYGMLSGRIYLSTSQDELPNAPYRVQRHMQGVCIPVKPFLPEQSTRCEPGQLGMDYGDVWEW